MTAPAQRLLAVCAHPDDESFGLGAVIDALVRHGWEANLLVLTRGEASTLGPADDLAERRSRELQQAAETLGIERVEHLDHPDGGLTELPLEGLLTDVHRLVRETRPRLLLVFDEGGITGHPDHVRATQAALRVGEAEGLDVLAWTVPRHVAQLLNAELGTSFIGRDRDQVDVVLPIDRSRHRELIACHRSQDNPVLHRRLELTGDEEWLRYLHRGYTAV